MKIACARASPSCDKHGMSSKLKLKNEPRNCRARTKNCTERSLNAKTRNRSFGTAKHFYPRDRESATLEDGAGMFPAGSPRGRTSITGYLASIVRELRLL